MAPALVWGALTAGPLAFADGATQVFDPGGTTTHVEHGRPTRGEWSVDDDGCFVSSWPAAYRARYELRWIVEDGVISGLRFTEIDRAARFDGRYAHRSDGRS